MGSPKPCCLVIGGAGFIGSHTVDGLLAAGYPVRVLDALRQPVHPEGKRPSYLHKEAELMIGDIRDRRILRRALEGVEAVFNFAAYQDYLTDFSTFFDINATGTALLYEVIVADSLPIRRVVVASSQSAAGEGLYRDADGKLFAPQGREAEQLARGVWAILDSQGRPAQWEPTPETFTQPQNPYGLSKQTQEQITLHLGDRYDIPSVAMRYSIVQGSRQSFSNAYSGACRIFSLCCAFGRSLPIYEDGLQVRDFVNIHDVVEANLRVLEDDRATGRVFNVGGGRPYSVLEFAAIAAQVFEAELPMEPSGRYRYGDTRNIVSDISALRQLGWEPSRSALDSLQEYRRYLEQEMPRESVLERAEADMARLGVVRSIQS
ncbi:MAG: NAD-dependent epimerase/dehydratase family protein [Deltaproteobacteria bacterium]|nr:NAD-dependent epimerase/dehydratase family protein [Deltaproteobacteria bacterium]